MYKFVGTLIFWCGLPLFAHAAPSKVYVQVRESQLRAEPKFWASTVAQLPYGTALISEGKSAGNKSWLQVKLGEQSGYVHSSAVTSRRVIVSGSGGMVDPKADMSSVVVAGKGFNKQVESSYMNSKGMNFAVVDEVERYTVSGSELGSFIQDGKLNDS